MRDVRDVGTYLGRAVQVIHVEDLCGFEWQRSTVLISTSEFADAPSIKGVIEKAFEGEALSVFVCGPGAEEAFSFMLDLQSRLVGQRHTMTYLSDNQFPECIEEFFASAWPSQDRFEEWSSYLIPFSAEGSVITTLRSVELPGFSRSPASVRGMKSARFADLAEVTQLINPHWFSGCVSQHRR